MKQTPNYAVFCTLKLLLFKSLCWSASRQNSNFSTFSYKDIGSEISHSSIMPPKQLFKDSISRFRVGSGLNNLPTYWTVNYTAYCLRAPLFKTRVYSDCKKISIFVVNKKEMNKLLVSRRVFI